MSWTAVTTEPSQLGESPFWHPQEHRLYWVDIAGRRVSRLEPSSGQLEHWPMPTEPGCIAPVRGGGLVVALRAGIFLAREWRGALEPLAELPFDATTERANDGKCDALGRFWVGSVHEPKGGPRQPVAALYCVDARGAGPASVRRMLGGAATANGLAWSPDGSTLYWCDTPSHEIRTWPCDAALEPQGAHSVFHAFAPKPADWQPGQPGQAVYGGRPDGGTVDVEGAYWSALYEGGRVVRLSPSGEVLADIPTPVRCPTMPCLGGDDGRTLFITSARQGRPAQELAELPQSGCVFSMRVAVPGLPVAYFEHGGG
ncbi:MULTISPECIES: SMP-30/gluconolactonase/LRE family protein [unclassified Acidovorax]|uniref:SMP-30/gluconolactonase/LRE family protein n=1 Tax=unclassified Acidovorax TaxID=2684926 RepID=UPI00288316B2|nr:MULTISPECIES: SMP-30/gluconolactonase/LRE family protein [unclassified Acidovorax]